MKCEQVQELMGAYLYGDLSPEEMRKIRLHAQECAGCKKDLESQGRVIAALDNRTPELSDMERQQIAWSVKRVVETDRSPRSEFRFAMLFVPVSVVVILLMAVLVVIMSLRPYNSTAIPAAQQANVSPAGGRTKPADSSKKLSSAVVKIREEPKTGAQNKEKTAQNADDPAKRIDPRDLAAIAAAAAIRAGNIAAMTQPTGRKGNTTPRGGSITSEAPAQVVTSPDAKKTEIPNGDAKLPQPTDNNDAQKIHTTR